MKKAIPWKWNRSSAIILHDNRGKSGEIMKNRDKINFTLISLLIGFMLAVQFQSTKENETRDTRDMWEIREDYLKAKELEAKLHQEIRKQEELLAAYQTDEEYGKQKALEETLRELREEAGLTEKKGPGIIITLKPVDYIPDDMPADVQVTPEVLRRLINELNMYGAKDIAIAEQRVVNSTTIREIQGETKIDGYPLRRFPIEIKVLAEDEKGAEKLYSRMQISTIPDEFFIDNLEVTFSEPKEMIEIPAYTNPIRFGAETIKEEGER
ncbi:MAG: NgoFVII family restriction endonuclease [Caldibacillus debilis]|nr:MAG: NgoFVII family restriction endonuclease [Caldibacillus debilis]